MELSIAQIGLEKTELRVENDRYWLELSIATVGGGR